MKNVPSIPSWEQPSEHTHRGIRLIHTFIGHDDRIIRLSWSPNGRFLATPSDDSTVRLWGLRSDKPIHILSQSASEVGSVAWSPDSKCLVSGTADGQMHIWSIGQTTHLLRKIAQHDGVVRALAWSPDGALLVSASDDQTIRFWETQSWQCIKTYQHSARVTSLTWSTNGAVIHGGADDSCIISMLPLGAPRVTRTQHANILDLVRSNDDMLLASSGSEGHIHIYDFWRLNCLNSISGHQGGIGSISFSGDRLLMASKSSRDCTVKIWRTTDWSEICRISETGDSRYYLWHSNIRFHPSLTILATLMDGDHSVRIWQVNPIFLNANFETHGITRVLDGIGCTSSDSAIEQSPPRHAIEKIKPTRASIRKIFTLLFKLDSEFDAFCIDYFTKIHSCFSRGMTLNERHNILLTAVSADKILESLRKYKPVELGALEHIIECEEESQ